MKNNFPCFQFSHFRIVAISHFRVFAFWHFPISAISNLQFPISAISRFGIFQKRKEFPFPFLMNSAQTIHKFNNSTTFHFPTLQLCNFATLQLCNFAILQFSNFASFVLAIVHRSFVHRSSLIQTAALTAFRAFVPSVPSVRKQQTANGERQTATSSTLRSGAVDVVWCCACAGWLVLWYNDAAQQENKQQQRRMGRKNGRGNGGGAEKG